jgi:hypothetical protein
MVRGREFILSQWGLRVLAGSFLLVLLLSRVCFSFFVDFTNVTVGLEIFAGGAGVGEGAWASRVDDQRLAAFYVFRERSEGAKDRVFTQPILNTCERFGTSFGVTGAVNGQGSEARASGEQSDGAKDRVFPRSILNTCERFGTSFGVMGAVNGQGSEARASGEQSDGAKDRVFPRLILNTCERFGTSFGVMGAVEIVGMMFRFSGMGSNKQVFV